MLMQRSTKVKDVRTHLRPLFLLACLAAFPLTNTTQAQGVRPGDSFYLYPKLGLTQYTGDRDPDLFSGDFGDDGFPWGAGLEFGYQYTPSFMIGVEGFYGAYPTAVAPNEDNEWYTYHAKLMGRYLFGGNTYRLAPFVEFGGFISGAVEDDEMDPGNERTSYGPLLGIGLDYAATDRVSVMLGLQNLFAFPDNGIDGLDADDNTPSFDLLNFLNLGVKYSFRSATVAPEITSLDCPVGLTAGEASTFRAAIVADATKPVEYRWDFGDGGATGTGLTATHTYSRPGTYTVSFTTMNEAGDDTQTCVVNVARAPVPASISSLTANPARFTACEPTTVSFNANVTGDEPLTYAWNFGDGTTGTGPNATHTYTEPGTYTITLTVTAPTGPSATRTTSIYVEECDAECENISELNSVFFQRNSSTLTSEGRVSLDENIELLRACQDLCVRIEGWAAPGERNPQSLSEDRARVIGDYYQRHGIPASRITTVGMGRVAGTTSKKEGGAQNQRADSIPGPCGL